MCRIFAYVVLYVAFGMLFVARNVQFGSKNVPSGKFWGSCGHISGFFMLTLQGRMCACVSVAPIFEIGQLL